MKISAACLALLVTVPGAGAPSMFNLSQYVAVGKHLGEREASPEPKLASRETITYFQGKPGDNLEKRENLKKLKGGGGGGGHGRGGHASSGVHWSSSGGGSSAGTAGAAGAGALGGASLGSAVRSRGSNGSAHLRSTGIFGADFEKYNLCLAFTVAVGMGVMV